VTNATIPGTSIDNDYYSTSFTFCEHHRLSFGTLDHGEIPTSWILLDNQSTIDIFVNEALIKNIRQVKSGVYIISTGGISYTEFVGDLPGYGTVWYDPEGIANILSLSREIDKGYAVTYDSTKDNTFHMTKTDGSTRTFRKSSTGLFFFDTDDKNNAVLVNTVADNQYKYSTTSYSKALLARKLQRIIGRPSTQEFVKILNSNSLPNSPVTNPIP
jgi:hypothetical protein